MCRRGRSRSRSSESSSGFSSSPSPVRCSPLILSIEGLSRNVTEAHIREIFGKFGHILDIIFPLSEMGVGKGYARVRYEEDGMADKAIKYMNGGQLDGNVLECQLYQPVRRDPEPRRRQPSRSPRRTSRGRSSNSRSRSPRRRSYSRSPPPYRRRHFKL